MRTNSHGGRIAIGLAAAAALTLTACGSNGGVGGQKAASQAPSSGPVTLQYWTWFPQQSTVQKAINAYEQQNPGVKIVLREFSNTDYQKQLPLALNGGKSLDIVGVQVSAMTNSVNTDLLPVSSWQSNLPTNWQSMLQSKPLSQAQAISKDNTLYDIPMGSLGSAVMYYNPALLTRPVSAHLRAPRLNLLRTRKSSLPQNRT